MLQCAPCARALRRKHLPQGVPRRPTTRQATVLQVLCRLGHRLDPTISVRIGGLAGSTPRRKRNRKLAVHQEGQTLAHQLHRLTTLRRHRGPRVPASRQPTVHHVLQCAPSAFTLARRLLRLLAPRRPPAGQAAVHQVPESLGHRCRLTLSICRASNVTAPCCKRQCQLTIQHERQTLAHLPKSLATLRRNLGPRVPPGSQLAVHQMLQ